MGVTGEEKHVLGVTICHWSNNLLMQLAQNDLLAWLATAKITLDRDSRHPRKKLLEQNLHYHRNGKK
jgi:hypothetical protein